jgi:hypothetical protein
MMAIKIGNACWQLCENVYGGLQSYFFQFYYLQLFKTDVARFFFLVFIGVNDYPWEIVGRDLVTNFTKSS